MRTIWIAGFALLMVISALFVTSALGAEGTPPLKAIVWLDSVKYGNQETATIKYLVTRTAQVTIEIKKPDGNVVTFGPMPANGGTILTQQVQSSAPAGTRTVTLTATAGAATATDTTTYEATGGLAQAFAPQNLGQNQQGQQQNLVQDQGQMPPADQGQAGDQGQPLNAG